ncbi:MAG: DNA repair protein RadC [Bacilli bacterium]|nr:DNA repair protein RadC [Bacilli bacterium]
MNNVLIKDIPLFDRPRERLKRYGVESLSNEELLSIILRTGTKNYSVKDLSNNILKEIKDITNLKDFSINKLIKINGVGEVKAITLLASLELGKRVYDSKLVNKINLCSSNKIYDYMKNKLSNKKQEYFYCLYLDHKKNLIEEKLLFIGTLNRSTVHPREIFKYAYINSSESIVCIHNHPSNDVLPSKEDIDLTNKLIEISKIQGIGVIDHIIIGNNNYYSFYDNGDIL